jgi:hypothetical protein
MKLQSRRAVILAVIFTLSLTSACANKNEIGNHPQLPSQMNQINMRQAPSSEYRAFGTEQKTLPIVDFDGIKYVSVRTLVDAMDFQSEWDPLTQTYLIGDYDCEVELRINSPKARKEENEVMLSHPPVLRNDTAYVPVHAVTDLFKEDMNADIEDSRMVIYPSPDPVLESMDEDGPVSPELDFADDPEDPFKTEEAGTGKTMSAEQNEHLPVLFRPVNTHDEKAVPVIKNVDMNGLIRKARHYLGVAYKFGAGPYPETGRFDCSSFTRYVFGKFGVKLNRTARAQAQQGVFVDRKSLRKGDLLFFYVPGRFKSNKTVGHVGIYMGNGNMIHAAPKPENGVQITNINKAYWKKTFLLAKRVV